MGFGEEEGILGGFLELGEGGLGFRLRGRLFCFLERELLFEEGIVVVVVVVGDREENDLLEFRFDLVVIRDFDLVVFFVLVLICWLLFVDFLFVDFFLEFEFELLGVDVGFIEF